MKEVASFAMPSEVLTAFKMLAEYKNETLLSPEFVNIRFFFFFF